MNSISVTECMKRIVNKNRDEAKKGTKLHDIFHKYLKTQRYPSKLDSDETKIFNMFIEFMDDFGYYKLIDSEKDVEYDYKGVKVKGKIDAIFYDENLNEIHIIDWKITPDISFESIQRYGCVMNIYAGMFQKQYPEYKKVKAYLVLMHQTKKSYIIVNIKISKLTLDQILEPVFETLEE